MNPNVGPLSFNSPNDNEPQFQKPYSEETAKMIDEEVRKLVASAYERTVKLLTDKKNDVEKVAQLLLSKEVLNRDDMISLLGKRPFVEKNNYEEYFNPKENTPPPPSAEQSQSSSNA
ncbi:unnamed protein product [Rhizophagus irregularis]|nr:unnamed protein product [Rhizophagus irregularis]CAB5381828.1 unnamed protein product [Rhizophagus irregularis]